MAVLRSVDERVARVKDGPPVLLISSDFEAGETRRRILATKYAVTFLRSYEEVEALPRDSAFAMVVLCYSLTPMDRYCILHFARMQWPWVRVLSITNPFLSGSSDGADAAVGALAGPYALLASLTALEQNDLSPPTLQSGPPSGVELL